MRFETPWRRGFVRGALLVVLSVSIVRAETPAAFGSFAGPFLENYCLDCHGEETQKGEVAFHELTGVDADSAELWKRIWEQVALKEMPPRNKKNQPAAMDRLRLSGWITGELERAMQDKGGFQAHLRPSKGNHLDHDLLFGKLPDGIYFMEK